ncbi:hypothetical protein [Gimesia panareensis]|uniref:hypothetical protein n=1 Tax=Gimesia panareensis TaxID=2527978 RepID=UPI0011892780|nr:hypothetical protein [Gimesia panareensis]QDU52787.1 hypothetical protein Pan110_51680 [Gimesia panareensis]
MQTPIRSLRNIVICLLCFSPLTGCSSLALSTWTWQHSGQFASARKPAVEVIALWEPAEGKGLDGLPTRGFAGQLLFFQHNNTSPVYVKGEVMVYLYDDQGQLDEQSKPIHQFNFDAGAWQVHAVESTLGPAYQVFIPYVRKGSDQAECALRVRLTQKEAPEVYSRMVSVKLKGKKPHAEAVQPLVQTPPPSEKIEEVVTVETLARRERGKRLELAADLKKKTAPEPVSSPEPVRESVIQQVSAESPAPLEAASVGDDRDLRIRRLEEQLGQLLNERQHPLAESAPISPEPLQVPQARSEYRQYRLSGNR